MKIKILSVLLVVIGFGFQQVNAQDIPVDQNLLNNYNFEHAFDSAWYVAQDGGEDYYTFLQSPNENGQLITWSTSQQLTEEKRELLHPAVPIEAGVEYTLRAKMRVFGDPAGQANMKLRFWYQEGETNEFQGEDFNNLPADSTVWFNHEITMVAPEGANHADVLFDTFGVGDSPADIEVDAVYFSASSNFTSTSNPEQASVPKEFSLEGNYPNPFNPATTIKFSLGDHSNVKLDVFNVHGQKVKTLIEGSMNAGQHQVMFNASSLPSGMYFYRLQAGDFSEVQKMSLIK